MDELTRLIGDSKAVEEPEVVPPTEPAPAETPPPAPAPPPVIVQLVQPKAQAPRGKRVEIPAEPAEVKGIFRKSNYFKTYFNQIIPTSEHIKVYKRDEDGKIALVNTYNVKELERSNDIEEFIHRFIVPKHGGGDYEVTVVNAKGEETRSSIITILDQKPEGSVQDNAMAKTLEAMMARMERLEEKLIQPKEAPPSLTERINEIEAIKKLTGGDSSAMMMLMQQRDRETAELRAELSRLKSDHHERRDSLPPPLNIPDPVPQAPPVDVIGLTKAVFEAAPKASGPTMQDLISIMRDNRHEPKKEMGIVDIVSAFGAAMPIMRQAMGLDQLTELKSELRELRNQPSKGLRETLEDLSALQQVMGQNQQQQGAAGTTFWDFMNNLVLNLDGLGDVIGKFRAEDEAKRGTKQLPPAAEGAAEEEDDTLAFPDGSEAKFKTLVEAKDDFDLIENLLRSLQWLAKEDKGWRKHVFGMLQAAKKAKAGDEQAKTACLEFIKQFADGLKENDMIDEVTMQRVIKVTGEHIDQIILIVTSPPQGKKS